MIGTIEGKAVAENQTDVCDKFFRIAVSRILGVRIGFGRVG